MLRCMRWEFLRQTCWNLPAESYEFVMNFNFENQRPYHETRFWYSFVYIFSVGIIVDDIQYSSLSLLTITVSEAYVQPHVFSKSLTHLFVWVSIWCQNIETVSFNIECIAGNSFFSSIRSSLTFKSHDETVDYHRDIWLSFSKDKK